MTRPLPPFPAPPERPTWWLLDPLTGWRDQTLDGLVADSQGALGLAPLPGSARELGEASGSLGGLVPPARADADRAGNLYLLDAQAPALKIFDPCECRFQTLPCIAGAGSGPRELSHPGAIAICGGDLLVADTGNRRVLVFALHGLVLRAIWGPPGETWQPLALACDRRGCVHVADPANGAVHRYARTGRHLGTRTGLGSVRHLALDAEDRLYLIVDGAPGARVFDRDGRDLGTQEGPARIAGRFPPLAYRVDSQGRLHLECGVFDLGGRRLEPPPPPERPAYPLEGTFLSEALDSDIYRCPWHRVMLLARVPEGARIRVQTHTAEAAQHPSAIAALPAGAWHTGQTMRAADRGDWDCLITSSPGRYLWLRLAFSGDGTLTPSLERVQIEFPRLSLRSHLPGVFGQDPQSADLTDRLLAIFDTSWRGIERTLDNQAALFDPMATPAGADAGIDFLTWLGSWIGLTLDPAWPEERRRRLLKEAPRLFVSRGTRKGLLHQLLLLFGWESLASPPPLILEHFQLRRWLYLGAARLGDQAVLWGRALVGRTQLDQGTRLGGARLVTTDDPLHDPFLVHAHRFSVFVPACYRGSERHRRGLQALLRSESPAHASPRLEYVEPRMRIGIQSMIGLDSVVGRYPDGMRLPAGTQAGPTLGRATVLGPTEIEAPGLRVGRTTHVGAKLD